MNFAASTDHTMKIKENKKKKTDKYWDLFAASTDHTMKIKENKKKKTDKYWDLAREIKKKIVEHESQGNATFSWCAWNGP